MTKAKAKISKVVTCNKEQRVYVIQVRGGYSCLGFQNAFDQATRIASELGRDDLRPSEANMGTPKGYDDYLNTVNAAHVYSNVTGNSLKCGLTPQLIGLEGKRVEVVDRFGEKRRFTVGKSMGWIPSHLEIANRCSTGGGSVFGAPFKSVTVVG
jgi:hypothetical protein